jgi:hypothetical protein
MFLVFALAMSTADGAYLMLNVDPEAPPLAPLPIGFDVILSERDLDDEGTGEAVWVVTHESDATLVAEVQTTRGLTDAVVQHGLGPWVGSELTRRIQGTDLVFVRQKIDELRFSLNATQKLVLDAVNLHLPADPRD